MSEEPAKYEARPNTLQRCSVCGSEAVEGATYVDVLPVCHECVVRAVKEMKERGA